MAKNWVARGKPTRRDAHYVANAVIEERGVLFAARSFDEALREAEKEAHAYARLTHRNVYGQRVVTKYLEGCDAFHLFEAPASRTEVVTESATASINRLLGPRRERTRTLQFEPFGA